MPPSRRRRREPGQRPPSRHRRNQRRGGDLDFTDVDPLITRVGLIDRAGAEHDRRYAGSRVDARVGAVPGGADNAPAALAADLARVTAARGIAALTLTADLRGDNDTINGQTYPFTRGQVARRIATGRGTITFSDAQIDFAALNYMEQEQPGTVGFYFKDAITKAEALTEVMAGCLGWWAVRANGLLAMGFLEEPTRSPVLTIHYPEDFGSSEPQMMQTYQAPRRATYVGWQRNYTPQDPSRLAGSVDAAAALLYRGTERFASSSDGFQASLWPTAAAVYVSGGFSLEASAHAEAARQQRVMGVRRERWRVTVPCDPFANLLGKVIQIYGFKRYGWAGARKFICVGMSFASSKSVALDLWG